MRRVGRGGGNSDEGPLEAYLAQTNTWSEEEADAQEIRFQETIAKCMAALSVVEREAYSVALDRGQPEPEPGQEAGREHDWEQNGCTGHATYEVYDGGAVGELFAALKEEAYAVWSTPGIPASPTGPTRRTGSLRKPTP